VAILRSPATIVGLCFGKSAQTVRMAVDYKRFVADQLTCALA